jgi:hypothetical protein
MAKRYSDGMYAGADARRAQERQDAGMLSEDHSAIANMPQGVIMREYPKEMYASYPNLDDTIRGVDHQMRDDMKGKKSKSYPEKY